MTYKPRGDLEAWAAEIAAALPPFTDAEALEVGRMAAVLDARRTHPGAAPLAQHTHQPEGAAAA